jgi:hypothetical protein
MRKLLIKKRMLRHLLPCFFSSLLLFPGPAFSQVKKVWALGDGEKVFRDDLSHPGRNGNFTWNGQTIRLTGLYNEVLAFQVIVQTGEDSAKGVEVAVRDPVNKLSGVSIGGNTLPHGPEGSIEVFSEHYLHVKDPTQPNWYYGSPASAPEKMIGWIPDALIPADATAGRGGFPLNVAADRNQGFWIDIELPRNQKNFPAGKYYGVVIVSAEGKEVAQIPLEITLLPYYLPDDDKATVWVYSGGFSSYFPGLPEQQVVDMLKFEAQRHRVTLAGGFPANESAFNENRMDAYKEWLDGTAFTPARGYHGNGEGKGEKLFPIGMYGAQVLGQTKSAVREQADLWVGWFQQHAPGVKYFWYMTDEPDSAKYAWIKERAEWIHSNPGIGKALPVFTTTAYNPRLAKDIDIWAGFDGVDLNLLPQIRKNGGDHWFYNGNRPRYGSVILEASAVDLRVNSWIMYKYGINTYFIWQSTAWDHNGQGPKKHLHQNIFRNPLTFINDRLEFGNGDGILFYPGRMPYYPDEDRGLNRVLPSIRLNNIRRGQQDAAIMWLAEQKLGREKVISLISKVLPKAMSEVSMKDKVPWSEHGDDYDRVRSELLEMLK